MIPIIRSLFKMYTCNHSWVLFRIINGDERNYATQEHVCEICNKRRYSGGNYKTYEIEK